MQYEKRYDEDGKVAVLISHGFGAGWSTWASDSQKEGMLFDSRLVDYVLTNGVEGLGEFAESLGYNSYMGGDQNVVVMWLDSDVLFRVEEYDGCESIRTFDDLIYRA